MQHSQVVLSLFLVPRSDSPELLQPVDCSLRQSEHLMIAQKLVSFLQVIDCLFIGRPVPAEFGEKLLPVGNTVLMQEIYREPEGMVNAYDGRRRLRRYS